MEDSRKCISTVRCWAPIPHNPAPYFKHPMTVAAPRRPLVSRGRVVSATVALAYASSRCASCSEGERCRKGLLRPPLRNPTLVCASSTRCAVMPAQDVTLLDWTEPSDCVTHSELPNVVTILFLLCNTARHKCERASKPFHHATNVREHPKRLGGIRHGYFVYQGGSCQSKSRHFENCPVQGNGQQ